LWPHTVDDLEHRSRTPIGGVERDKKLAGKLKVTPALAGDGRLEGLRP
jgi:hypothetical protein